MPRPLIMKVETHQPQPARRIVGHIDQDILSATTESPPDVDDADASMVRSLISRYDKTRPMLKHKSKSLADLQGSPPPPQSRTQDDFLYKDVYKDGQRFDFKKVLSMFEGSGNVRVRKVHRVNVEDIQAKARRLLDRPSGDAWREKVLELLREIVGDAPAQNGELQVSPDSTTVEVKNEARNQVKEGNEVEQGTASFSRVEVAKEPQAEEQRSESEEPEPEDEVEGRARKVRDIKNIFETALPSPKPFVRSISSNYFGVKEEPSWDETHPDGSLNHLNGNSEELDVCGRSADMSAVRPKHKWIESDFSSMKIQQLKGYFEPEKSFKSEEDAYDRSERSFNEEDSYDQTDKSRHYRSFSQPNVTSPKIQSLKNCFEDHDTPTYTDLRSLDEDVHVINNRVLPPPKVLHVEEGDTEESKGLILELLEEAENYEQEIEGLSSDTKHESSRINEMLIRILIKLDDVQTFGNGLLLAERKRVICLVKDCIKKLRVKIEEL